MIYSIEQLEKMLTNLDYTSPYFDGMPNSRDWKIINNLVKQNKQLMEALLNALPYVEDVLHDPDQLKCFKKGRVEKDCKLIREALEYKCTP